jgi:acylphosphatase
VIARRLSIRGRVQGVGYRDAMMDAANAMGVAGWVRNRRDGTVEAWLQGDAHAVERLIAWCRKGSSLAYVTKIATEEVAADPALDAFMRRKTE